MRTVFSFDSNDGVRYEGHISGVINGNDNKYEVKCSSSEAKDEILVTLERKNLTESFKITSATNSWGNNIVALFSDAIVTENVESHYERVKTYSETQHYLDGDLPESVMILKSGRMFEERETFNVVVETPDSAELLWLTKEEIYNRFKILF